VSDLKGGVDVPNGQTLYDFTEDFNPTVNGGDTTNYVINFRAQSFNADEDKFFYFSPFSLDKVTMESQPTFTFTVNQKFRDEMKNNLVKYQVWIKKDKQKEFMLYLDEVPVTAENNGQIVIRGKTKLIKGKYQIQIRAVNVLNHNQQSNNLNIQIKK
jgi:hypothetical protein